MPAKEGVGPRGADGFYQSVNPAPSIDAPGTYQGNLD